MTDMRSRERWLFELQGPRRLSDEQQARLAPAMRFAPAVGAVLGAWVAARGSAEGMLALAAIAAVAALTGVNALDALFDHGARRVMGGDRVPPYSMARRFACALGAVGWMLAAMAQVSSHAWTAAAIGTLQVVVALTAATTGFCLPCWVYRQLIPPALIADTVEQEIPIIGH